MNNYGLSIRICALLTAINLAVGLAHADPLKDVPQIESSFNCFSNQFETFEKWLAFLTSKNPNFQRERFPFTKAEFDTHKQQLGCHVFKYLVDEQVVEGYVIYPKSFKQELPTIIYNRGGNTSYGRINFGKMLYDLMPLALEGYVVIGSQYRWDGSEAKSDFNGNGKNDEFGGVEINDVLGLIPIIEKMPFADKQKLALLGVSRGGMQSYLFAKKYHNIKAMIVKSGISDVFKFYSRDDKTKALLSTLIPDFNNNKDLALSQRSAVYWVDKLPSVPIMLIHAKDDNRVDYSQSSVMAAILSDRKRPFQFLAYDDGSHDLTKHRKNTHVKMIEFLKLNMK